MVTSIVIILLATSFAVTLLAIIAGIVSAAFNKMNLNDKCIKIASVSFCLVGVIAIIGFLIMVWKGLIPW